MRHLVQVLCSYANRFIYIITRYKYRKTHTDRYILSTLSAFRVYVYQLQLH